MRYVKLETINVHQLMQSNDLLGHRLWPPEEQGTVRRDEVPQRQQGTVTERISAAGRFIASVWLLTGRGTAKPERERTEMNGPAGILSTMVSTSSSFFRSSSASAASKQVDERFLHVVTLSPPCRAARNASSARLKAAAAFPAARSSSDLPRRKEARSWASADVSISGRCSTTGRRPGSAHDGRRPRRPSPTIAETATLAPGEVLDEELRPVRDHPVPPPRAKRGRAGRQAFVPIAGFRASGRNEASGETCSASSYRSPWMRRSATLL